MKKLSLFISVLICSIFIISCGQGGSNSTPPDPDPTPIPDVKPAQAYIANNNSNTISVCYVESTGALIDCVESDLGGLLYNPTSIAVDGNYIYVGNQLNGSTAALTICSFTDGIVSDCTNTESPAYDTDSGGISINNDTIYFTNADDYAYSCPVNGTTIGTCVKTNTTPNIWGGPVNFTSNYTYGVNNYQNSINVCSTSFDNCTDTGDVGDFSFTSGMAINSTATLAYIITPEDENQMLNYCSINTSTGLFDSCNSISAADSLINIDGNISTPTIYGDVLYVPNSGNDTISVCPIADNGSIKTCTASTMKVDNAPVAIYIRQLFY